MSDELPECQKCGCRGGHKTLCENANEQSSLAETAGSALTDAQKIQKAIELLEYLEANCLVPDMAHDAFGTCRICGLIAELKAPNAEVSEPGGPARPNSRET